MTSWIERLRQKKSPYGRNDSDKSAESGDEDLTKKFVDGIEAGAKSDESADSVTFGTSSSNVSKVSAPSAQPSEVIIVAYQCFSLDYDLPDGTYTPEELRRARLLVKPGAALRYRLRWPGGTLQPSPDLSAKANGKARDDGWLFGLPSL
jgi:hypothetical protein